MRYFDFHCHLDHKRFSKDRETVLNACLKDHLHGLLTVADAYEPASLEITEALMASAPGRVFCVAGAHPHNADAYTPAIEKELAAFIQRTGAVGVGECGLDFYYTLSSPDNQRAVFRRQIALSKALGLPLVVHSRNAEAESLALLAEAQVNVPVVFHCYTGPLKEALEILKRGWCLSFSGVVTFDKTGDLHKIVRETPLDRLFTETDAPYLSPAPERGKRNRPDKVRFVAEKVAELKGIDLEMLNKAVWTNFEKFFLPAVKP